jgi:hypothetical protein
MHIKSTELERSGKELLLLSNELVFRAVAI